MSGYLKFYELDRSPFEDDGAGRPVLGTKSLREALETIRSGLDEDATRICVSGGPGLGKTSLARALPKLLAGEARVAVVLDPAIGWDELREPIARQWKLGPDGLARGRLVEIARQERLVLVVDQAERADAELLDHLDVLLSYRTDADRPAVQCVLFAQLAPGDDGAIAPILWWLDRIQTLELEFPPLPVGAVGAYIEKQLERAGWSGAPLFTPEAAQAIHARTGGVPGEVGRLCERLLEEAAARDVRNIEAAAVAELLGEVLDEKPDVPADLLQDEFEQLALEEEFEEAAARNARIEEAPPSLASGDATTRTAEADADALAELEAFLSRPPTDDELRAMAGERWRRRLLLTAGVTGTVLLAALLVSWLRTEPDPGPAPAPAPAATTARAPEPARAPVAPEARGPQPELSRSPEPTARPEPGPRPAVLGRPRGPVPDAAPAPTQPVTSPHGEAVRFRPQGPAATPPGSGPTETGPSR